MIDLRSWPTDPARAGLFLDFDGTLAPIVDNPEDSGPLPGVTGVLEELVERFAVLAVVSGRPAAFLQSQVPVPGVRLLGLYGLEEAVDGTVRPRPEVAAWQDAVDDARGQLGPAVDSMDGVTLEDKGLSVAVHWRNAPDRERTGRKIDVVVGAVAHRTGLAREPGKFVAELRPPVEWDKGAAVRSLAETEQLAEVAYAGDDLGDLAAFAAVRDLGGAAIAVDHGVETPAEVRDGADLVLDGPAALLQWLRALRDRLDG